MPPWQFKQQACLQIYIMQVFLPSETIESLNPFSVGCCIFFRQSRHAGCSSACQLANIPSPQASGRLADIRCFLHLCQRITTCRLHQHLMASSIRSSCRQPIGTNVIALSQVWIQKVSCNSTKGISILIKYSYLFGVSVQWWNLQYDMQSLALDSSYQ
jgi:hypothetical protein